MTNKSVESNIIKSPETFNDFVFDSHSKRSEMVSLVVAFFALIAHIAFFFLFLFLNVKPMALFNIFSVVIFSCLLVFHNKKIPMKLCFAISCTEVILHQALAVFFIGINSGFHFLIILEGMIPFLVYEDTKYFKYIGSFLCGLFFVVIHVAFRFHEPIYKIAPIAITVIEISIISSMLLLLFLIVIIFTISVQKAEKMAFEQYSRAEHLLCNILPNSIAEKLKISNTVIAERYESVTVLFFDIVDFSQFSERLSAEELVRLLNNLFSRFDLLCEEYHVEKIKTIGDAYMVACGLPERNEKHSNTMVDFAMKILSEVQVFNKDNGTSISVRIGINSGTVVAGIIGLKKFIYDLWGSTVNYAARMESSSLPNRIQVSAYTYELLKDSYEFEKRENIQVKGFGYCTCYLLIGKKQ